MQPWQNETTVVKWFVIGLLLVVIISICFVLLLKANYLKHIENNNKIDELNKKHIQNLELSSVKVQENERQRIGSDLHDSVINSLNILYLKTQTGLSEDALVDNIEQTIDLTRRISHELNPPFLEHQTIEDALTDIFLQWSKFYNIQIKVDFRNTFYLKTDEKTHLIRVVQELITNIHKHAKCTNIDFRLRLSEHFLAISLKDDGIGFCTKNNIKGLGLTNIQIRANILKAKYKFKNTAPKGTSFLLIIKNKHNEVKNNFS